MIGPFKRKKWVGAFIVLSLSMVGLLPAYRQDLIFTQLSVKDGLSQGSVSSMLKDKKGYMWFGTIDGLNRFDGLTFIQFHNQVDNPDSLSGNDISCIFEDVQGTLWVGTQSNGLNRMEPGTARFYHYRHHADDPFGLISDSVNALAQDGRGDLWVGTNEGLDRMPAGSDRFVHYPPAAQGASGLGGSSVTFLVFDREGKLWIGLRERGVDRLDPATGRFAHYGHDPKNDRTLASDRVVSACLSLDGMVWICHDNGHLSRLDPKSGAVERIRLAEPNIQFNGVCTDTSGNIWAASRDGLFFLNGKGGEPIHISSNPRFPSSLSSNWLNSVLVDDTDIIWLGTFAFGINKSNLKAKNFTKYSRDPANPDTSLSFDFIEGIYENPRGVLYVGGEKLDRFDPQTGSWRHFYAEASNPLSGTRNFVVVIFPNSDDPRDFLWLGTDEDGLFTLDQARQVIRPYPLPGMHGRSVRTLYRDTAGYLWIGTNEGLHRYDQKKKEVLYYDLAKVAGLDLASSASQNVYWITQDRQGLFWIGSRTNGLFSLDPQKGEWRHFAHDPANPRSLSSDQVTTILETKAGELWIGTYGGGMNLMDRSSGTFEYFTTRRGLPNDVVYGILEDDEGQLWVSCNLGLARFDPRTKTFRSYTEKDGLTGNEFNSGSYFRNPATGRLFFGGTNGVTVFHPREIRDDPHPPYVVLEDFKIFNRSVAPGPESILKQPINDTDSISLSYRDSMLTFEFNALHYISPIKNRFAYFLEGFDQQWNQTDAIRRYATYTNLNPGHYTLRVKAANCDGVWNETGKSLAIYIAPPFWKTWWFTVLMIAFLSGLLLAIYHFRVRGLQKRKAELEKLVALRTQELKEMSLSDPMTNLRNRRYVSEVVMDEVDIYLQQRKYLLANPQRRLTPIPNSVYGLFIIDVDFFKTVNDRFGHKAGDLFLGEFAGILRENVRQDDVVVRWGGEEFLVILKNCDPAFLVKVAEKIRGAVEARDFLISEADELRIKSSCCIGIARFPFVEKAPDLVSFDHTIMLADMAMYMGKEGGRNRTICLEHSGKILEEEALQKILYSIDTLKASGFIKILQYPNLDTP